MSIMATNESEAQFLSTVSTIELLNPTETPKSKTFYLKTTREGHLYNHPIFTAYNKTSLGSIPTKLEKTLMDTKKEKKTNSIFSPQQQHNSESTYNPSSFKTKSVSLSKKGYGNGFISKTERFDNGFNDRYRPGPCEYPIDKISIKNDVSKSLFSQGLYNTKENHSLLPKKLFPGPWDYNPKYYNDINIDKNSYFFTSDSVRFKGSLGNQNNNPGPGKYFNVDKDIVKDKDRESYFFKGKVKRKDNPTKRLKIDIGDYCDSRFKLIDQKGEVNNSWRGNKSKILGRDFIYIFDKKKKDKKNKIFDKFKPEKYNNRMNEYDKDDDEDNINYQYVNNKDDIYTPINPNNVPKENLFKLNSPRWKSIIAYNADCNFKPPGPAYYHPILPKNKVSFNLNDKDFIYTNGLPFAVMLNTIPK